MLIDPFAIIQVDATIITGILILLTITKFVRTSDEFWLPKGVASIVLPFSISALLAIWQLLTEFSPKPEGNFIVLSLIMMLIGFLYLIGIILKISIKNNWKKNR